MEITALAVAVVIIVRWGVSSLLGLIMMGLDISLMDLYMRRIGDNF